MPNTFKDELKLAVYMADRAKKLILKHFQGNFKVEWKRDNTPVTIADKTAEEFMRTCMLKETPDYGIIGEEFGKQSGKSGRQWVIDPIDGTKAFIHGVPLFGTLLALLEDGEPVLGLVDLPALGHRVLASKGGGAKVDGKKCMVSRVTNLSEALVLCGSENTMETQGYGKPWATIRQKAGLARGWGDCYGHFLVATGKAELMVDPVVEIWDIAPFGIIIPEAGGVFSSIQGKPGIHERSGISCNAALAKSIQTRFKNKG